jgi:hypothetical protein
MVRIDLLGAQYFHILVSTIYYDYESILCLIHVLLILLLFFNINKREIDHVYCTWIGMDDLLWFSLIPIVMMKYARLF